MKTIFSKLLSYITLNKKQKAYGTENSETTQPNTNLKLMHGINRISIVMFLIGIIIVVVKIIK